jgi:polyhydroxyalkanoate synthase
MTASRESSDVADTTADVQLTGRAVEAADGGEPLGRIRLPGLAAAGLRAARPRASVKSAVRLTREAAQIVRGSSEIAAARQDWRFRDPTWQENPLYRRLMQLYLAWTKEVEDLVEGAQLEWRDAERARFLATVLTSAWAPTNTLPGNPEALKRLLETGGASVVRGTRNLLHDMRHNGGMPSTVNSSAFTV